MGSLYLKNLQQRKRRYLNLLREQPGQQEQAKEINNKRYKQRNLPYQKRYLTRYLLKRIIRRYLNNLQLCNPPRRYLNNLHPRLQLLYLNPHLLLNLLLKWFLITTKITIMVKNHQTMKSLLTSLRRLETTKNLQNLPLVCLLLKVKINTMKDRNQHLLLMIKVLRKWACPFKAAALLELMIEKRKKCFWKFRDSNPFLQTN